MNIVKALFALLALLLFVPPVNAQGRAPAVSVAPVPTVAVVRGRKTKLKLDLTVNRGFHINSNKPHDDLLLPTTVRFNPPGGVVFANILYPEGEELVLPFMGKDTLSVYSSAFRVTAEVRATAAAALGTQRIHGEVKFQACDNRQCFPSKTAPFDFDVRVVRARGR
ncbi:MAG: protein-disulfide reductase DsbD family protein [Acidobacteriota bacterium]|nr:protein-disulfide reductase DsbD family protein [Acidobacteriota bacterium]